MPLYNSLNEAAEFQAKIQSLQSKAQEWHTGFLRYEVIRKLNPVDYTNLWKHTLLGHKFDDLVDEIVLEYQLTGQIRVKSKEQVMLDVEDE